LLGYPVAFSTQITLTEGTNGSWAALLDTSQLLVAERRPARLEVSREFKFDQDLVSVRATWRGALVALNPEAISLLTDIRA
jgi:HK97 family phage major capsid protein